MCDESEDTACLYNDTIDLIDMFNQILDKTKVAKESAAATAECGVYCQCSQSTKCHQRQQLPATNSNDCNLHEAKTPKALNCLNEIHLVLRLESWVGDNGMLYVNPSLHQNQQVQPPVKMLCDGFSKHENQRPTLTQASSYKSNICDCKRDAGAFSDYSETRTEPKQKVKHKLLLRQQKKQQPEPAAFSSVSPTCQHKPVQNRLQRIPARQSMTDAETQVEMAASEIQDQAAATVSKLPAQQKSSSRANFHTMKAARSTGDLTSLTQKLHRAPAQR